MTKQSPKPMTVAPEETLLRLPQVLKRVPVSRSHWWAGVADGRFPAGIRLSDRITCWKSSAIDRLIESFQK